MTYYKKYLIYKTKYLKLKNQLGGGSVNPTDIMTQKAELVKSINYTITNDDGNICLDTVITLTDDSVIYGKCEITIYESEDMFISDLYVNKNDPTDTRLTNCGIGTWMLYTIITFIKVNIPCKEDYSDNRKVSLISTPDAIRYYEKLTFTPYEKTRQTEHRGLFTTLYNKLRTIVMSRREQPFGTQPYETPPLETKIDEPQIFTLDNEKLRCIRHQTQEPCEENDCWWNENMCKPSYLNVVKLGK